MSRMEGSKFVEENRKLKSENLLLQYELSNKGYEVSESGEKIVELLSQIEKLKEELQYEKESSLKEKEKNESLESQVSHITKELLEQQNYVYRYAIQDRKHRRDIDANEHMITLLNEKFKFSIDEYRMQVSTKDIELEKLKDTLKIIEKKYSNKREESHQLRKKLRKYMNSNNNSIDDDSDTPDSKEKHPLEVPGTDQIKEQVEVNLQKNTNIFGQWFKPDYPNKYELRDCKLNGLLFICDTKTLVWKQKRYILRGNVLYYFEKDSNEGADGEIRVEGCTITKNIDTTLFIHNFQFIINHPTLKMLTFATQTEKQLNDWLNGISAAIESYKKFSNVKHIITQFESLRE